MPAIYFDMDGTLADFYGVNGWLEYLHNEDTTPYEIAESRINTEQFKDIISSLKSIGFTIGIISWSAKNGSKEYNKAVRRTKKQWLFNVFGNVFDEFHVVKYGTPKHRVANIKDSILVDDDINVRNAWKNGQTIDATNCVEMMETLVLLAA